MRRFPLFFTFVMIGFLFCALLGLARILSHITSDFGPCVIQSNLPPFLTTWSTSISDHDQEITRRALLQDYHYLAKGSQSYVFLSEDGQYVIKFFRHKRWKLHPFYQYLPLPPVLEMKKNDWKQKKWETLQDTFKSCQLAYQLFKEDTGILFVHLNKTKNLKITLNVKDRLGCIFQLPLDRFQFIVQKKAIPIDQYFLDLRKIGNLQQAKKAIDDLLLITKKRALLGYNDKDPHPIRNFGCINGKIVEVDVGGFYRDPKKGLYYYKNKEILKIRNNMLSWTKANYPEITAYVENRFLIEETFP